MTATFELSESNGASETVTDGITNLNYGSADQANLTPADHPITAGENSYEKWVRCHFTGTFNKIDNIRIWKSAGDYVTGESIKTNLTTDAGSYSAASYSQPTQNTSTVATNDMPTSEPSSANLGIGGSLTGSLTSEGYSDYWVSQLQTTTSTPPGDVNTKTFTIKYDEQ